MAKQHPHNPADSQDEHGQSEYRDQASQSETSMSPDSAEEDPDFAFLNESEDSMSDQEIMDLLDTDPSDDNPGQGKVRGYLMKIGLPATLVALCVGLYSMYYTGEVPDVITEWIDQQQEQPVEDKRDQQVEPVLVETLEDFLPTSTTQAVIRHDHYALSYAEKYEQPEWVAYELTAASLKKPNVDRHGSFSLDSKVPTGSAHPRDYTRSGFDRGHLAPAADMAFSEEAMKQSFFMSNVSPQEPAFNRGIWRELEEQTRDWCYANQRFYIVTGPVLTQRAKKRFGKDKSVAAPRSYYKILLDLVGPEQKAVAFLLPNTRCNKPISDYIVTIDSVESITGIDFFPALPDELEAQLEATYNPGRWIYDQERYALRVGLWNAQASLAKTFE